MGDGGGARSRGTPHSRGGGREEESRRPAGDWFPLVASSTVLVSEIWRVHLLFYVCIAIVTSSQNIKKRVNYMYGTQTCMRGTNSYNNLKNDTNSSHNLYFRYS
ncbi:hypothetical protein ACQJBY_029869 [Aegilops geniculata]